MNKKRIERSGRELETLGRENRGKARRKPMAKSPRKNSATSCRAGH